MKKPDNATVSDLLKLGQMALNTLLGAQKEFGAHAATSRDALIRKLDLVTREEFDAAFAMIKKARVIQNDLDKRLSALEKKSKLSRVKTPQKAKPKKQIRAKK